MVSHKGDRKDKFGLRWSGSGILNCWIDKSLSLLQKRVPIWQQGVERSGTRGRKKEKSGKILYLLVQHELSPAAPDSLEPLSPLCWASRPILPIHFPTLSRDAISCQESSPQTSPIPRQCGGSSPLSKHPSIPTACQMETGRLPKLVQPTC